MMSPQLQTIIQIAVGHILNSLPEGLLIAIFAWIVLRFLPRQNAGTRFAVWFVALLAVSGLPLVGGMAGRAILPAALGARPLITLTIPWGFLLFLIWVLAACTAMLRLAAGVWRLRALRRSCIPIDLAQIDPAIRKTITKFFSSRSVTLATSEKVSVPSAFGFFKPMIVIPAWAMRELPHEDLNIILLHEFAHVRRWDDWTNLFQKAIRAVFFFHPAIWWIDSRLSLEREMACDDAVLAETANPHGYAKCLIGLLEKSFAHRGWTMAQGAVHRAREASLRVAQILDVHRPHAKHVWKPALAIVGVFSLMCLVVVQRVPDVVGFDRTPQPILSENAHPAAFSEPESPMAVAIPAAMRTGQSQPIRKLARPAAARMVEHPIARQAIDRREIEHRRITLETVAARWIADNDPGPIDAVTAEANQAIVPGEALLVLRTTQQVAPDSWVLRVSVWRITLLQDHPDKGPASNKT
jgi:beta-lactamase regulating signal transducer with metallopeptidase domain